MSGTSRQPIVRQQEDRIAARKTSGALIVGILLMLGGIFVAGALLRSWVGPFRASPASQAFGRGVGPADIGIIDQTPIDTDRYGQRLRESQRRTLEHYAWTDRAHGVARIPIERAMDIVSQRGVGTPGTPSEPPMPAAIDVRIPAPGASQRQP